MCDALYEIMKDDIDRREAKAIADATDENTVSNLKSLIKSTKWSIQQAMDALNVSADKQEMYAARLKTKSVEMA